MVERNAKLKLEFDTDQAQASLGEVTNASETSKRSLSDMADKAKRAIDKVNGTTKGLGDTITKAAGALGTISTGLNAVIAAAGATDTELGSLAQSFNTVATAAGSGAAAFGPWGAVIGGSIALVTEMVTALDQQTQAIEASRDALSALISEAEQFNQRQALLTGLVDTQEFQSGIAETRAAIAILEREIQRRMALIEESVRISGGTVDDFITNAIEHTIRVHGEAADAVRGVADAEVEIQRVSLLTLQTMLREREQEAALLEGATARNQEYNAQNRTLIQQSSIFARLMEEDSIFTRARQLRARTDAQNNRLEAENARRRAEAARRAAEAARREREEQDRIHEAQGRQKEALNQIELNAENAAQALESARGALARFNEQLDHEAQERHIRALQRQTEEANRARREYEDLRNALIDAHNGFTGAWTQGIDGFIDRLHALQEAQRAAGESITTFEQVAGDALLAVGNSVVSNIGEKFSSAFADALGAVVKGEKDFGKAMEGMLKTLLEAIFAESIVQALKETALAIGDLASYRYDSAALHFAAAGAWTAVAVATGAGAAAMNNAQPSGAGASPSAGAMASNDNGQAQPAGNITIVYNGNVFATRDELTRDFEELLRRSQQAA